MSSLIDKKALEHLAKLARIEFDQAEEEKLLGDLKKILAHFEELEEIDTKRVEPMAGGTRHNNVFREDAGTQSTDQAAGIEQFPEKDNGFLKVPPVFNE